MVQSALSSSLSCIENCRPSGLGVRFEDACVAAEALGVSPRLGRGETVECSVYSSSSPGESSCSLGSLPTLPTNSTLSPMPERAESDLSCSTDSFGRRRRAEIPGEDLELGVRSSGPRLGASPTDAAGDAMAMAPTDAAGGEMASSTCRLRVRPRWRAAAGCSSQHLEGLASSACAAGGGGVTCGRINESAGDGAVASGTAGGCVSVIACRSQRSPGRPSGRAL